MATLCKLYKNKYGIVFAFSLVVCGYYSIEEEKS